MYSDAEKLAAKILNGDENDAGLLDSRFCEFLNHISGLAYEQLTRQTVALAISIWESQNDKCAMCSR